MLVYANSFTLASADGPSSVVREIASGVGRPRKFFVDPTRLAGGISDLRLPDGASLKSRATLDDERQPTYPYYFYAQLSHGQPGVPGRRWITEVGVEQGTSGSQFRCSVLLRTDEVSAKAHAPIQAIDRSGGKAFAEAIEIRLKGQVLFIPNSGSIIPKMGCS